jgi:hypothetical protein
MPASCSVQQGNHRVGEKFLHDLKAGLRAAAYGGRPRPPHIRMSQLTHAPHWRSITLPI